MRRTRLTILALLSVLPAGSPAQDPAPETGFAITGVTVIDVAAGKAVPDRTVLIAGEKITRIGPAGEVKPPEGAVVVDGAGRFLIPGLVDSHAHLVEPKTFGLLLLANGVTFAREMGSATEGILEIREKMRRGELAGPDLIVAGAIVDGVPPTWPFSESVDTPEAGRAAVQRLAEAGVDFIKVYTGLQPDVYRAVLDEARKKGLRAAGHIPTLVPVTEAAALGQATSEHLTGWEREIARLAGIEPSKDPNRFFEAYEYWNRFPDLDPAKLRAVLEQVKSAGLVQVPTLVVIDRLARTDDESLKKDPRLQYLPAFLEGFWRRGAWSGAARWMKPAVPHQRALVKAMHEAGVPMLCGTDIANPWLIPGFSLHEEMALWQELGIPAADVLRSATLLPAKVLRLERHPGEVLEGRVASLVLLRGDPLQDIRRAADIEEVFLRGRRFDRAALDGLLEDARKATGRKPPAGEPAAASEQPKAPAGTPDAARREATDPPETPGETVARGTYSITLDGKPWRREKFRVTKDGTGWRLAVRTEPEGGAARPSESVVTVGPDRAIREAEFTLFDDPPVAARYVFVAPTLAISGRQGGKELRAGDLTFELPGLIGPESVSIWTLAFLRGAIEPGADWSVQTAEFGSPSWETRLGFCTINRVPDVPLMRPDGREVTARFYATKAKKDGGPALGRIWTDQNDVVLKFWMRTHLGVVEAVLQDP